MDGYWYWYSYSWYYCSHVSYLDYRWMLEWNRSLNFLTSSILEIAKCRLLHSIRRTNISHLRKQSCRNSKYWWNTKLFDVVLMIVLIWMLMTTMDLDVVTPSILEIPQIWFHDSILRTQISLITFPRIQILHILNEWHVVLHRDDGIDIDILELEFFPSSLQNKLKNFIAYIFSASLVLTYIDT